MNNKPQKSPSPRKPHKPGTPPNTSLVLTQDEIDYIDYAYNGSRSAAIHAALALLMQVEKAA